MTALEVIGHREVLERLSRAVAAGRLAHGLLFGGPEGVGKARVARRLVALLFCAGADRPCGSCAACRTVLAGSHPDLRWLSPPASGRDIGIDAVREVRRFVGLAPVRAGRKAVVIDEADRLTVAAQNALLKTLEEPPPHSFLILVTARPDELRPTIRSRCQRVTFGPLAEAELERVLSAILGPERRQAAQVGRYVAQGSPGRVLRILESLPGGEAARLEALLERASRSGRYADVLALADAMGGTDVEMGTRLEWLLGCLRERLDEACAGEPEAAARILDAAAAVERALALLRHRGVNRSLLAQVTALRLR